MAGFIRVPSMGRPSFQGTADADTILLKAPVEKVWKILLDVEHYHNLYRNVDAVENLTPKKSINPVETGAKYVTIQTLNGREYRFACNVTRVQENTEADGTYIFAMASDMLKLTLTSTYTLRRSTETTCQLFMTYGLIPNGFLGKISLLLLRGKIERDFRTGLSSYLEDIRVAAEEDKEPHSGSTMTSSQSSIPK